MIFEKETGKSLSVIEGYRTPERSKALYDQGRTLPGRIVSWVKPFFSWHNYGLAFDVAPTELLNKPDWDPDNPLWQHLGQIGKRIGLRWGGDWKSPDKPHFEFHPGLSIREVYEHFKKTGQVLVSKVLRYEVLFAIGLAVWYLYRQRRSL